MGHSTRERPDGTLEVINSSTGRELARIPNAEALEQLRFSSDGTHLVALDKKGTIQVWDAGTGEETARVDGREAGFASVALSPDNATLATGGPTGNASVWDLSTDEVIKELEHPSAYLFEHSELVNLAYSPDGTLLAASEGAQPIVWDLEKESGWYSDGAGVMSDWVNSITFSADAKRLATGGFNGSVIVWELSNDGVRFLSPGDANLGIRTLGHADRVHSVAFSEDGTRLASGSEDGTARVWDLESSLEIARLAHNRPVREVEFRDGTRELVTVTEDGTTKVWNVDLGPGNFFEVLCRRLPTQEPPAIVQRYGLSIGDELCTGEEPLPSPMFKDNVE